MGTTDYPNTIVNANDGANYFEAHIKEQINKGTLTKEQFAEYTTHYCWYCGRPFSAVNGERHIRSYKMTRKERKTKALRNIVTTYTRSIPVPECSECSEYHRIGDVSKKYASIVAHILGYGVVGLPLIYMTYTWWREENLWMMVMVGVILAIGLHFILYNLFLLLILPSRLLYCKIKRRNYNSILRDERQIPLVKSAKKEGFRRWEID